MKNEEPCQHNNFRIVPKINVDKNRELQFVQCTDCNAILGILDHASLVSLNKKIEAIKKYLKIKP